MSLCQAPLRALALALVIAAANGAPAQSAGDDFSGLVDIGGGRELYLECRGTGSPIVVLVSGKGNHASDWSTILDPADPAHDAAYDVVAAGEGDLHESPLAVLPMVARFTRVCAYDRPGTRIDGADISTPVPQPHTVDQAVDDLRRLLTAAGEPGPYVLVAHSYGGFIATLFARTDPADVAGLVMVDAGTELIEQVASPEALAKWDAGNKISTPQSPEAVELADAIGKIDAAPRLPERPMAVLSADKPWQPPSSATENDAPGGPTVTFADWLAAQNLLAASLRTRHVTQTRSGHHVYMYAPQLVVAAIRDVVDAVRQGRRQLAR
ncbi:MAG: alpha/beta hydrolase [Methyloceanibacter sp.]